MRPQIIIVESGVVLDQPQKNRPIIVILTGDGVIEKPITLCDRITKSNDFYWSRWGDTIAFTRKDQLKETFENQMLVKVVKTVDDEVMINCKTTFKKEYQTIKNEQLLKLYRKQLTYPFLGAILLLLLANFLINQTLTDKNSTLQQDLSQKRKNSAKIKEQTAHEQKIAAEIKPNRKQKISVIVDKIASTVPDKIVLTTLSVDPLIRSPEQKKSLQLHRNTVVIKGLLTSSSDLSEMTHSLSKFLNEVKIKKIEQEIFEIEARL